MAGGSTTIFMRRWDPVQAMEIIEREKVAMTGGVPTIAWQLIEHPDRAKYDLSSLEAIAYGGAPSAPELVKRIYEEFRSEEHTSELQSLMRISYAVFCLKKKTITDHYILKSQLI